MNLAASASFRPAPLIAPCLNCLLPSAYCLLLSAYCLLSSSLCEAVLLLDEARVVKRQVVFDLAEGDDREVVADAEREPETVHLAEVLVVGLVAPDEQTRPRVEVEPDGRAPRGRRLDEQSLGAPDLLPPLQRQRPEERAQVCAPAPARFETHLGQLAALDPAEA